MGKKLVNTAKKVSLEKIENIIKEFTIANKNILDKIDIVAGISRGGLVPAALLAARIDKPLVAVYIDKSDKIYFDRPDWIGGKNILVVDDIVRSGKTLWLVKNKLGKNLSPASISFFTLFKVLPLVKKYFLISSFSREIDQDVFFPWDC